MKNWKTYKIGDLAEKIGMGPFGSSIKVDTFVNEGIPVISGTHLKGLRLIDRDFNFITLEHADKLISANVKRGDVIFTHAGNIGAVAYIPNNSMYDRYIYLKDNFYLRCDRSKLLPEFITYYFKTPFGQKQLLANSSSVGVPSIAQPVTYLRSIEIKLPTMEEQIELVNVLVTLDDKIDINTKMNETMGKMAFSIFDNFYYKQL